jgi:hypothetical protein
VEGSTEDAQRRVEGPETHQPPLRPPNKSEHFPAIAGNQTAPKREERIILSTSASLGNALENLAFFPATRTEYRF